MKDDGHYSPSTICVTISTRNVVGKTIAETKQIIACYPWGLGHSEDDYKEYAERLGKVIALAVEDNAKQVKVKMFGEENGR